MFLLRKEQLKPSIDDYIYKLYHQSWKIYKWPIMNGCNVQSKILCGTTSRQRRSQLVGSQKKSPSLQCINSRWCVSDEAPSSHVLVAAFPECPACLSPHLDLGQGSGCWTKDELGVGGGLSLHPKSCWSAICVRVEADVPETRNCSGQRGCQLLHLASCNDERCK